MGATIQSERGNYFAVTDTLGNFQIEKVAKGEYKFIVRFLGFKEQGILINVIDNITQNIFLEEDSRLTDEVIIRATRATERVDNTQIHR